MTLLSIAFEAGVVIASAFAAALAARLVFRKPGLATWSYLAAFIPRAIILVVSLTGASGLGAFAWLSHTAGAFIYPMLLAMGNILLIEGALAGNAKRQSSLPLSPRRAKRIMKFLKRLQDRRLLPRAAGVKEVYFAGVLAGMINLIFVLVFGLL